MKASSLIMYGLSIFMGVMAIIYIIATTMVKDDGYQSGTEWAGIVGIVVATAFTAMLGTYLHLTERKSDILPEDWEEAEIADKAGVLGFFSPSSIWPFAMACSIFVLGLGVIYLHYWLIALGAVLLIYTGTRLNLQYGLPREKH